MTNIYKQGQHVPKMDLCHMNRVARAMPPKSAHVQCTVGVSKYNEQRRAAFRLYDRQSLESLLDTFWSPFTDIPAPSSKYLHHIGRDRGSERDPDKDEALMYGVCEGQLRPYT